MIKNFEEQTTPLSEYEETRLLPMILRGLRTKVGKALAVTNRTIVVRLTALGYELTDARVRKIINYIRRNDLIPGLVGTSNGYYIATDPNELMDYEESLRSREDAIKGVRLAIKRQREILFPDYQPNECF